MQTDQPVIETLGPCGKKYHFKAEYGETWVLCPNCKQTYQIPKAVDYESLNALEKFVHKRNLNPDRANEKILAKEPWQKVYEVDQVDWMGRETYLFKEKGSKEHILVADRPGYFKNAFIMGTLAWLLVSFFALSKVLITNDTLYDVAIVLGFLGLGWWSLAMLLRFKFYRRDIHFYSDERMSKSLFRVVDQKNLEYPKARFLLLDGMGEKLATFVKPWKNDLFRSYWEVYDSADQLLFYAIEESVLLSFLRRLFFTKLFWFRVNFVLKNPMDDSTIGEFNRSWMIKDHYTLDLSLNTLEIEPPIWATMGVLLDTVERR